MDVVERLATAVDNLDDTSGGVRKAVFREQSAGVAATVTVPPGHAGVTGIDETIEQLPALARNLIERGGIPAEGHAPIQLLDAGHSLYGVLIYLSVEPTRTARVAPRRPDTVLPVPLPVRSDCHVAPHRPTPSPLDRPQGAHVPTRQATKAKTVRAVFTLPAEIDAEDVALCGEFNNWSPDTKLMRDGDGSWQTAVALPHGTYRDRYLIDGTRWENAWEADDYVPNPYGSDDSVVIVD
jgi:Glycogen recognition site of AMP-activated protein kinase